jgi:hypothetical protein
MTKLCQPATRAALILTSADFIMEIEKQPPSEEASDEPVVFIVRRDTRCSDCGRELLESSMITLSKGKNPLCLVCADMDHLEYLPRGNTALTRRATRYSRLRAVVVKWSRSRNHYERQGILAEPRAIERAEAECLGDAERRNRQRARRASREAELDREYVAAFAAGIRENFPGCPPDDARMIAEHACRKYSERVGRSAAAKRFEADAIRLAVTAAVRHDFTNYNELLLKGHDRYDARALIRDQVEEVLDEWRAGRQVKTG